ncbi:Uncharacterized protein GNX_2409 [Leptospira interrogans serovar Canicola]|nr:Uncharacterized protein GNX_2409 [Leptospira interrogans serovar Canicola]
MQENSVIDKNSGTTQIVHSTNTYNWLIGIVYKTTGIFF